MNGPVVMMTFVGIGGGSSSQIVASEICLDRARDEWRRRCADGYRWSIISISLETTDLGWHMSLLDKHGNFRGEK